jgi:glycosyltransferase involved in cell wall biosynthesis
MASMSEPILVSVVVDSYNYARYLGQAVDSALGQTYPHTEVIVVDDGSTDGSWQIVASYGDRVRALRKANGGKASAFNAGFEMSRGRVVWFLDSDDALLPRAVEGVVGCFDDESVSKAHCPLWEVDESGRKTGRRVPQFSLPEGDLREALVRFGPAGPAAAAPPTTGNAWARSFLERVLPMPEQEYLICPDAYLAALAPLYGRVVGVPEPQALYRMHGLNNRLTTSFDERLERFVARYEQRCGELRRRLWDEGVQADVAAWHAHSWMYQVSMAADEMRTRIPPGVSVILADDGQWGVEGDLARCECMPFLEEGGTYCGPPPDDRTAVRELERLRAGGAAFFVLAWPAFWWLDCYPGFLEHLRSRYEPTLEGDRVIIFDLRT